MERWQFPEQLAGAIRNHHCPDKEEDAHRVTAYMVHVADIMAYMSGIGAGMDGFRYRVSRQAIKTLKLNPSALERVSARTLQKMSELEFLLSED
jgi:HD-like signal output (HDOD) protein